MTKLITLKTSAALEAKIKKQGLSEIPYTIEYHNAKQSGYFAVFQVDNVEDRNELISRGFHAVIRK